MSNPDIISLAGLDESVDNGSYTSVESILSTVSRDIAGAPRDIAGEDDARRVKALAAAMQQASSRLFVLTKQYFRGF